MDGQKLEFTALLSSKAWSVLELREHSNDSTTLAGHFPPLLGGPLRRHLPSGRRSLAQLRHYVPSASGAGIRQLRRLHVLRGRPTSVSPKRLK